MSNTIIIDLKKGEEYDFTIGSKTPIEVTDNTENIKISKDRNEIICKNKTDNCRFTVSSDSKININGKKKPNINPVSKNSSVQNSQNSKNSCKKIVNDIISIDMIKEMIKLLFKKDVSKMEDETICKTLLDLMTERKISINDLYLTYILKKPQNSNSKSKKVTDDLNGVKYNIIKTDGDGNCFFYSIFYAYLYNQDSTGIGKTIQYNTKTYNSKSFTNLLRKEISEKFNQESLQFFKFLKEVYPEDYEWFNEKDSIKDIKAIMNTNVYWADQWAISETEKLLSYKIIIYEPDSGKIYCTGNSDTDFNNYIILNYVGGNHYELIRIDDESLFTKDTLPVSIRDKYIERCVAKPAALSPPAAAEAAKPA
jgi:hypothetical protein